MRNDSNKFAPTNGKSGRLQGLRANPGTHSTISLIETRSDRLNCSAVFFVSSQFIIPVWKYSSVVFLSRIYSLMWGSTNWIPIVYDEFPSKFRQWKRRVELKRALEHTHTNKNRLSLVLESTLSVEPKYQLIIHLTVLASHIYSFAAIVLYLSTLICIQARIFLLEKNMNGNGAEKYHTERKFR